MDTNEAKPTPAIQYGCPVEITVEVIGGKWKCVILWWLRQDAKSFGELKQLISGITSKVLTQQLRELEVDSLIHREAYREVPRRVEYSLTPLGKTLQPITELMCEWGKSQLPKYQSGVLKLDKLQVLVVTNDARLRELLYMVLESRAARVIGVTTASEALEQIQLQRVQPDVLLVDTEMPWDQGYDLVRQVRALGIGQQSQIPAIALTNRFHTMERRGIQRGGFQVHLSKPIEPAELVAALASLTGI